MGSGRTTARARAILRQVKPLAPECYALTGKPLGVTGEIGEAEAARIFGLELASARAQGFDATRDDEKIQIKARVPDPNVRRLGRMSRIDVNKPCDTVMLVILVHKTLNAKEVWQAPFSEAAEQLGKTQAKSRQRGQLAVASFKSFARLIRAKNDPCEDKFGV